MLPVIRGIIDRRILVTCRADPAVLSRQLPPPFRPKVIGGAGIAGICLIRLRDVRPAGLPAAVGLTFENAAHRIAVEWDDPAGGPVREGVYIGRPDTSSRLATLAGGRVFPGVHHTHGSGSRKPATASPWDSKPTTARRGCGWADG